jgi:hypothetical protein
MAKKEKLEKDYIDFNINIERIAESEIKNIQQETNLIRDEAQKIGTAVELAQKDKESNRIRKKVNT